MAEEPKGCARTTGAVVGDSPPAAPEQLLVEQRRQQPMTTARVGQKAPDFQAPAYHRGTFTNISLSSLLGKWVLLCFYPGDFTFV
jgi:peroxiredoxin (alkyl hydroperoxide reductase subunit C)